MITQKEKHNRQKQACMARLVARGFQESLKLQTDNPTVSKECSKMLRVIATNFGFKFASVVIRAQIPLIQGT